MKNPGKIILFVLLLVAFGILGCSKKPEKNNVVAKINDYTVTIEDFEQEKKMALSGASKEEILDDIITKELLLEEAQKMGFDKDKKFMKEIENYWKQALIKRIISYKGNEFLESAKGDSQSRMKDAEVMLNNWIDSLKNGACIIRNDAVLGAIKEAGRQDGGSNAE